MRVYCPNCGSENDGAPGARVNCPACTASFEVPPAHDAPPPRAPPRPTTPVTPSPLGGFAGSSPAGRTPAGSAGPLDPSRPFDASRPLVLKGRTNNTLAIVSLVTGILCCIPFGSFVAVGTGIAAIKQLDATQGREGGRNLAIAGIVLGGLGIAVHLLAVIGAIFGK